MSTEKTIVFMGTPGFAAYQLQEILNTGIAVKAVVTIPDKPMGRGQKMSASAVKEVAIQHNIPLLQPEKLKDNDFIESLREYNADLFVVVAFRMLPEVVWKMPALGTINLHASLLPQYRGAAPINWAVMNGEKKSGATTFFINDKIDEGNIIAATEVEMTREETAGTLHDKIMTSGAPLLVETIRKIFAGDVQPVAQTSIQTGEVLKPAPKIHRETCHIKWNQPATQVCNRIRGLSPYPAAWTTVCLAEGKEMQCKILMANPGDSSTLAEPGSVTTDGKSFLHVAAADAWVEITVLQPEGKKKMPVDEMLRGFRGEMVAMK